jgi:methyl-CpG-binding domain protein 4
MANADPIQLSQILRPLGFYNRRARTLIKFSEEWITKDWAHPKELYGIGEYAAASWDIFYKNQSWIEPSDGVLVKYLQWKRENHFTHTLEN